MMSHGPAEDAAAHRRRTWRCDAAHPLRLRFIDSVDPRLRAQIEPIVRWIRRWYPFPHPFEIRLVNRPHLIHSTGERCALQWWQSSRGQQKVTVEIAVGTFAKNLAREGPAVAYPTVVAAIGRGIAYYYRAVRDLPERPDLAERWGDRLLGAIGEGTKPPAPWRGARTATGHRW